MKLNSITTKIILSSVIPIFLALLGLAIYNYYNSQRLQTEAYDEKRQIINKEIQHIFDLQDVALKSLEMKLDEEMERWSTQIITNYLDTLYRPLYAPLKQIQLELGMDTNLTDIYIINKQGIIINTTFPKDYQLNLFNFGEDHKNFLLEIFSNRKLKKEPFTNEASTRKVKKYSYQATLNGKYIVEIGSYSSGAQQLNSSMQKTFKNISNDQKGYRSVDLFIITDDPFSFTTKDTLSPLEKKIVLDVQENRDTVRQKIVDGVELFYDYSKLDREFTDLYRGAVMRLIYDKTELNAKNKSELLFSILIFSIVTVLVAFLIFILANRLTKPLKTLSQKADFIAKGNFNEHVEIKGSFEITRLSQSFDSMVDQLRDSLVNLENKVEERTKEVDQKRTEIENQKNSLVRKNKRIESSLKYALTIQKAILPTQKMLSQLADYFILYRPKDFVSGDSYWISSYQESDRKSFFFAVIDCTGHGVPGAFMTLIADRLLNSVVNDRKIHSPAKILENLDHEVRIMLRQDQNTNDDGMDVALIKVDVFRNGKKTLTFSGAKRPLYLHRYENESLEIIKGSIRAIGGNRYGLEEPFKNIKFDINKNDIVYLFSDGIIDQKTKNYGKKKFGTKGVVQFINENAMNSSVKQLEKLEKILDYNKDPDSQIDDITLVGLRF
ncbi:MAG: SpoIIE family protein phosphatase [Bacteroidales bacterium]|nr:SpoIIE family protein phosphatase [Bacteroidales bacterium]